MTHANAASSPESPSVLVLATPRVWGWPSPTARPARRCDAGELCDLGAALTRQWSTDAHAVAYSATVDDRPSRRRLASAAVDRDGVSVAMTLAIIDADAPEHTATPEWRADFARKLLAVEAKAPGAFAYHTRGGARLVWRLARPFEIASRDDAAAWSSAYRALCDWLAGFGIEADRACADWTRLFRLPDVVRDGARQSFPVAGNPSAVGALDLGSVIDLDRLPDAGDASMRRAPKCERIAVEPEATADGKPHGLMATRLVFRGLVRPGVYAIECPNAAAHSADSALSSTVYFPPAHPSGVGRVHCHHRACAAMRPSDWLDALDLTPARQVATVLGSYVNTDADSERVQVRALVEVDGGGGRYYVRASSASPTRWRALWESACVEPPSDLDPAGDLGDAAAALVGRRVAIEVDARDQAHAVATEVAP